MSGGATILGAINTGDSLDALGGGISNGSLGSDMGVLSTNNKVGALATGNCDGIQDMGSGVLGDTMGSRGGLTNGGSLRHIRGACI
jgi:hypothetical protein